GLPDELDESRGDVATDLIRGLEPRISLHLVDPAVAGRESLIVVRRGDALPFGLEVGGDHRGPHAMVDGSRQVTRPDTRRITEGVSWGLRFKLLQFRSRLVRDNHIRRDETTEAARDCQKSKMHVTL